jgi:hypothetical protein
VPPEPHAVATLPGWHAPFSQHPAGQLAALHTHAPPTHASPWPHGGLVPHWQAAPTHESAVLGWHTMHAAPPAPHVASDGELHVAPLQQPLGHEVVSQTHCPLWQRCPAAHGRALPQVHEPAEHASASVGSHVMQPPPEIPHALIDIAVQVLPLQQPIGHEVASQVHAPAKQCCPARQAAPAPQAHAPLVHESERTRSHCTHVDPPIPQPPTEGTVHALPLQQPVVHVWAQPEHTPASQVSPVPHGVHLAPAVPHAVCDGGVHVLPLQQPVGHEVASHVQAPATQCWPAAQGAPVPQVHAPFMQESAVTASQGTHAPPTGPQAVTDIGVHVVPLQHPVVHEVASHAQAPPAQCWPAAHAALVPQEHAPFVHAGERLGSHATHAAPPIPHVASEDVVQALPAQHPFGHDCELHTHCPLRHAWPELQAAPPPQVQLPPVHPSASFGSHGMQAAPLLPHSIAEGLVHALPEQQPVGQFVALQAPPSSGPSAAASAASAPPSAGLPELVLPVLLEAEAPPMPPLPPLVEAVVPLELLEELSPLDELDDALDEEEAPPPAPVFPV